MVFEETDIENIEVTNIIGFNESKEDIIWSNKRVIKDKKNDSYAEPYHCLIKIFVNADTNRDDHVSRGSFSKALRLMPTPFSTAATSLPGDSQEELKEVFQKGRRNPKETNIVDFVALDEACSVDSHVYKPKAVR